MAVITIDGATFCHGPDVTERVAERLQLSRLGDEEVFSAAADLSGIAAAKLSRMVYGPTFYIPSGTRETVTAVAALRVAMVEAIAADGLVYHGLLGHLLPTTLTHVLRVCLAGTHDFRLAEAGKLGIENRDAKRRLKADDEARADWIDLVGGHGAWDKSMYDIFIAMQETSLR